jgi:hypothetical protein
MTSFVFCPPQGLASEKYRYFERLTGNSGDAKLHILTYCKTFLPFYDLSFCGVKFSFLSPAIALSTGYFQE